MHDELIEEELDKVRRIPDPKKVQRWVELRKMEEEAKKENFLKKFLKKKH